VILKAPFPWFGGKSRVAHLVWSRFGDVPNYVEPFFGSGAVLLNRPHEPGIETVNDLDCMVANFWRSLQRDPESVAHHADNPVNEADQHARHLWLCSQEEFRERMKVDPEYYDSKIAGWWVWGQCIWIGSGWCSVQLPHLGDAGKGINRQLPHLGDAGKGINRQRPHLGGAGMGINRKRPHLGDAGMGCEPCLSGRTLGTSPGLVEYMLKLADRLRSVRVCCGNWDRICGPTPTVKLGTTAVFLDPPYADDRQENLYSFDGLDISGQVFDWAIQWGNDPRMRIALCGYDGEHEFPTEWECVSWKAAGGYGSQGEGRGAKNAHRERIWFSPRCLKGAQKNLFEASANRQVSLLPGIDL
jgi:DNA adenine methylase